RKNLTEHVPFQNSVNLVFERLKRDIVHYEMNRSSGPSSSWLDDPAQRQRYLMRVVESESRVYVKRFSTRYAGKPDDDTLAAMLGTVRKSPPRVATVLR
ncbi:hypothetical protein AAHH80_32380, partial [Burkholderia pseudomallei]